MIQFSPPPDQPVYFNNRTSSYYVPNAHVFEPRDIAAVQAALSTRRPLLLRGEPGVGKSQLAMAAAIVLRRVYVQHVVNALTEPNDILWHEDAVRRLADAQIFNAYGQGPGTISPSSEIAACDPRVRNNYIAPGALWWAFDWETAKDQATKSAVAELDPPTKECSPQNGVVILIDEIDKAGAEVPNSLLEAFGSRQFFVPGRDSPVKTSEETWPLVIITTNEERILPNAFLRRCVVHDIKLPDDPQKLKSYLVQRAGAHFGSVTDRNEAYEAAAEMLIEDRVLAKSKQWEPLPGLAEYLDLLRAVEDISFGDAMEQVRKLEQLKDFFYRKHPESKDG
ncbi:AAA family ATPase [Roseibium sediminis]|uniref:AAA family ATPase n=1 Tax=Roseibium sediminis TaxID=1775174 RepID=UPI00123D7CC0|nr:MoxR family ATPase [Roseibium sediminis]